MSLSAAAAAADAYFRDLSDDESKCDDESESDIFDDESTPDSSSSPLERALPPNTRVVNEETGQLIMAFWRGGGKQHVKYGKDVDALVAWRREIDARLDAEGVPPTQVKTAASRQSATPGVHWHKASQKWRGQYHDRLASKNVYTSRFATEAETVAALAALRGRVDAAFEAEMQKRYAAAAESTPNMRNLPRAPDKAADAEFGTVYWHVVKQTAYVPYRAVRTGKKYEIACADCPQFAHADGEGGTTTHCVQHGGGKRCLGPIVRGERVACPLDISVQKGKGDAYDSMCVRCFCATKPDDPRAELARKCMHVREQTAMAIVKKAFPEYNWTFDKTISVRLVGRLGTTRFRPDARTTHGGRVLILEIDEHSHRGYLCAKEREREASFVAQCKSKIVILIRFNPDAYTDYKGVRHPSCFSAPSKATGSVHVHPKQKAQWDARMKELVSTIRYQLDPDTVLPPKQTDRPMLTTELFYDNVLKTPEDVRVAAALRAGRAMGKRKRECAEA
jgi:hypothetical protein